jgi:SAM-dependent methyltransferase
MSQTDLFAEALWAYYQTGHANLRTERDDGFRGKEDVSWYFTRPSEFPPHEKAALRLARGHVLDVGCGAGRHSLYLQNKGLHVTAVDVSPSLVELAQERGVKDVQIADATGKLPFRAGQFGTVLLFGNNLGIGGTIPGFRSMLRELKRVSSSGARILGTTRMPNTTDPRSCCYLRRNIAQRRPAGQVRLRLEFGGKQGGWFNLLLFSPTELMQMASKEGWELTRVMPLESLEEGYAVVLEKV